MSSRHLRIGLTALSEALTARGAVKISEDLLSFARADASQQDLGHVAPFFYRLWDRMMRVPGSLNAEALRSAARQSASMDDVSQHLRTALDYLMLCAEADQYFEEHELRRLRYSDLAVSDGHISAVQERLRSCRPGLSTHYGLLMLEAMLASLHDRDTASELFHAARAENPDFAAAQLLDSSVGTYLTEDNIAVNSGDIAKCRSEFMQSFELLDGAVPHGSESTLLLFSCDPIFFAAFFPYWASATEYLREQSVYLHFLLVCDYPQATATVERALALATAVARLRGFTLKEPPNALSFSTASVPTGVDSAKTVYACARYLVARELSNDFDGRVLILDIDMVMRDDPAKFLSALHDITATRLPVVMTSGMMTLVPARRYLAGRVFLPSGDLGQQVMQDIEDYIYVGLFRAHSWALDQNALTYANERAIATHGWDSVTDVGRYIKPFGQEPIRQLYRDSQWRHEVGSESSTSDQAVE